MRRLIERGTGYTNREVQAKTGARSIRQITNSLRTTEKAARIYIEAQKEASQPKNKIIRTPITRKGRQAKVDYLRGRIDGIKGDIRDEIRDAMEPLKRIKAAGDALTRKWAMRAARDMGIAKGPKGVARDVARTVLQRSPQKELRAAEGIIRERAKRAAAAAARGSKPAARATEIYDRQLAPVLPKGKGKGKNVIKPGPRNTQGPQKPKRKRKPKPKG
jgi:hypothetical protein